MEGMMKKFTESFLISLLVIAPTFLAVEYFLGYLVRTTSTETVVLICSGYIAATFAGAFELIYRRYAARKKKPKSAGEVN